MALAISLALKQSPRFTASSRSWLAVAAALLASGLVHADNFGPNILPSGNFDNALPTYVPWAGVDNSGNLHGIEGRQLAVADNGNVGYYPFGPGVASADLNGDGKPDIILADSKGFYWFFPNSGTPDKPAFTQGEVIPIWLGKERVDEHTEGADNIVSRIQAIDVDGSKKLNILAGTYTGEFFNIPNVGSGMQPMFKPTLQRDLFLINTHRKGALWCNYLAPALTTAFGNGNALDLIMGEGTYSANSIYFLKNTNTGGVPAFDEDHLQKIIPGMGLEQLTPVVVDWNNDGKPDVLFGDRTGTIHVYLNNSTDPSNPTFAAGTQLTIGGVQKFGGSISLALADLTGNHLPNLLIGKDDGTVLYALNTGKLGAPVFSTPATPVKGVLPPTYHYTSLPNWAKGQAYGVPDELVGAVNPQNEPGFTFPDGVKSKNALKFWVWPVKNTYFPERYYPPREDTWTEHIVSTNQRFVLELNKRYRVHFWMKAEKTIPDFHYWMHPVGINRVGYHAPDIKNNISCGSSWTEETTEIRADNPDDPSIKTWPYGFQFSFQGQTTFYIADLSIELEK
jgi:hypothetical protein